MSKEVSTFVPQLALRISNIIFSIMSTTFVRLVIIVTSVRLVIIVTYSNRQKETMTLPACVALCDEV